MINPPETPQPQEASPQPNSNQLGQLYTLMNESNNYVNKFNSYFDPKKTSQKPAITILKSQVIYLETIPPKKINELPFSPKSINDFYSLTPVELMSYLNTLSINQQQRAQIIEGWLAKRMIDVSSIKLQSISFSDDDGYSKLSRQKRLTALVKELQESKSLENWDFFYRVGQMIIEAKDDQEKLINIKNNLSIYSFSPEVEQKLSKIIDEKTSKKTNQKKEAPPQPTEKTKKEKYDNALEEVLDYLGYSIDPNIKRKLSSILSEKTLQIVKALRDSRFTPQSVEAYILSQLFWPLRLGRKVDLKEFKQHEKKLLRYFEANLDKSLRTEAAGFWFEKNLTIPNLITISNEQRIIFAVENLIKAIPDTDIPHKNKPLRVNINIDDKHIIKITLTSSENIEEQIKSQLTLSSLKKGNLVKLKSDDLYQLKQNSYTFGDISKKSTQFQQGFGHKEKNKFLGISIFEHTENDDYAIRINTEPNQRPKTHPLSLFMVEHHKALLNLDIDAATVNIAMKFAHKHFDGKPAKDVFLKLINEIKKQSKEKFGINPVDLDIENVNLPNTDIPIFEAFYSVKFDDILSDIKTDFNPSFIYSLATALNSDVDHFHFLVAGPDIFSESGPYSNIQPAIVSLIPIKNIIKKIRENTRLTQEDIEKLKEWREKLKEEYKQAKNGLSTPAVLAGTTGSIEDPLKKIGQLLGYHQMSLVTHSQGMFSALITMKPGRSTEGIIFHTAKSDSYQQKINLENPPASMGVVGFNQSQDINGNIELVFSVRKMPSQAQREIKDWLVTNGVKNFKPFERLIKDWERLIQGEINLDGYYKSLQQAFNSLPEKVQKQFKNFKDLQIILNDRLYASAKNTASGTIADTVKIAEQLLTVN